MREGERTGVSSLKAAVSSGFILVSSPVMQRASINPILGRVIFGDEEMTLAARKIVVNFGQK